MQKMGTNLPELEELKLDNIGGYYNVNNMASDVVMTTMPRFFFLGFSVYARVAIYSFDQHLIPPVHRRTAKAHDMPCTTCD